MKYLALGLGFLALVLAAGLLWFVRASRIIFAQDAVHMIALQVNDLYRRNPAATPDDVEGVILHLHHASVINLKVNESGRPLDPFGTPFQVHTRQSGRGPATTVRSAGPDGRFGTSDDVQITAD
jgi:hypothetical protein